MFISFCVTARGYLSLKFDDGYHARLDSLVVSERMKAGLVRLKDESGDQAARSQM